MKVKGSRLNVKIMKKTSISLLAASCFLLAANCFGAGTTASDFLNITPGARPAGMEAFVAVADETSGMYWNPAGLAYSFSPEFQAMYSMWLAETYYGYMGYSQPTSAGTFGLGVQYLSGPEIPKISNGVKGAAFGYSDTAITLPYAVRMSQGSAFGVNLKSVSSKIDTSNVSAFTADAGFLLRTPEEGFSFGVAGQNLFGQMGDDKLPQGYKGGFAFKADLPEHSSSILLALEGGKEGSAPSYAAIGVEHWGANTLGLRFGYKYYTDEKYRNSLDTLAVWRAGLSIRIRSIAVDYAYQPFAALGVTHKISFTWRGLGWLRSWKIVPCAVKADPVLFSPNNDGRKDSVFFVPTVTEVKEVKNSELQITDAQKNIIWKYSKEGVLPKIITWEGQMEAKQDLSAGPTRQMFAPEGKYLYRFIADGDGRKRAQSEYGEIIADLTPAAALLQVSSDTFSPNDDGLDDSVTFYISVSDAYGIDGWKLEVLNDKGKPAKTFKSASADPVEMAWNGRDDYYNTVVTNGPYEARLTAWDMAGNRTVTSSTVTVLVPAVVKEVVREIKPKEDSRGLVVNLSSQVLYAVGKATLKPAASKQLDEVVNLLQTYSENKVQIEGHTDSTGSRKKNIALSGQRGWSVYSYLVKHGIEPSRLKVVGIGPDKPIASNRTAAGRAKNRRVEIIILKKPGSNTTDENFNIK